MNSVIVSSTIIIFKSEDRNYQRATIQHTAELESECKLEKELTAELVRTKAELKKLEKGLQEEPETAGVSLARF